MSGSRHVLDSSNLIIDAVDELLNEVDRLAAAIGAAYETLRSTAWNALTLDDAVDSAMATLNHALRGDAPRETA